MALVVLNWVYFADNDPTPVGGLSGNEQAAVAAASTEAANLGTYTRANYEKDYQRAVDGTTGALTKDVASNKAAILTKLKAGTGFDIKATVRHAALVGPAEAGSKDSYVVLVVLFGYQSTSPAVPNPQNLQVTVTKIKGAWKASDVTQVQIS